MIILKRIFGFFLSLRTAVWLLVALVAFLLFGAIFMPTMKEFETINSMPFLEWLAGASVAATWWLWGALAVLSLLTANTLVCSVESVIKKWERKKLLLVISPQVIHIGFLFMLLAHLLSSAGGMRAVVPAREGSVFTLPDKTVFKVSRIDVQISPGGFLTDFKALLQYSKGGVVVKEDHTAPNRPSFFGGYGIYIKDVRPYPVKTAVIEVSREPGAVWALLGGVFFSIGTVTLIVLRMRQEEG